MRDDPGAVPDLDAQLFETSFRVRFHEVDALGHVNNSAYLNYLEQAAIDHALLLGLTLDRLRDLGGVFVARRHDIVFLKPSYAGDLLRVITWLDQPRRVRVTRHYAVYRESAAPPVIPVPGRLTRGGEIHTKGAPVVQATTEWVFAGENGQPRRIPDEVARLFRTVSP